MNRLTNRFRTLLDARRHKGWLFALGLAILSIVIEQYWTEIKSVLEKWIALPPTAEGGLVIFGLPFWALALPFASLCFVMWMLEYASSLRQQLEPKLAISFEPDNGGLSETILTDNSTGQKVDDVKYIRLGVQSASQKSVRECVANIVKIERRLDLERTEAIWDQDALALQWAMRGGFETKIHYLAKRFVDVACVRKKIGRLEVLINVPNRLAPELNKYGIFIFTIVVTGDDLSTEGRIEIETDGTYHGLKARPL